MQISLIGPTYVEKSALFTEEECINFFPVSSPNAKNKFALYPTPGLSLFATLGNVAGEVTRGMLAWDKDYLFVVTGGTLYNVNTNGGNINLGIISGTLDSTAPVSMAASTSNIIIATGGGVSKNYSYNVDTNSLVSFANFTDGPSFGIAPSSAAWLDGYFILNSTATDTKNFIYVSELGSSTNFTSTRVAAADSHRDAVKAVATYKGKLVLFGEYTTEFWYDTGNADFPFAPIRGSELSIGIPTSFCWAPLGETLAFVGRALNGNLRVYALDGYMPIPISTTSVEQEINSKKLADVAGVGRTYLETIRTFSYTDEGHEFFVVTVSDSTGVITFVYDVSTKLWHKRESSSNNGWLPGQHAYFNNKHVFGARTSQKLFLSNTQIYTEDSALVTRKRILPPIHKEDKNLFHSRVRLDIQPTSVANSNVVLYKKDRGESDWTFIGTRSFTNKNYVEWFRLGYADHRSYKFEIEANTAPYIVGGYADIQAGYF